MQKYFLKYFREIFAEYFFFFNFHRNFKSKFWKFFRNSQKHINRKFMHALSFYWQNSKMGLERVYVYRFHEINIIIFLRNEISPYHAIMKFRNFVIFFISRSNFLIYLKFLIKYRFNTLHKHFELVKFLVLPIKWYSLLY